MKPSAELDALSTLIRDRCGLSFPGERLATLSDAVASRTMRLGISTIPRYMAWIQNDEAEFRKLVNLLTINETYFFREPLHLDMLAQKILPETLMNRRPGDPVRILSAGCSTGEEPYSIVLAVVEQHGPGILNSVSVVGADIDSDALLKGEQGVYTKHSFRGFPDRLVDKYFEPAGSGCRRVKEAIKKNVQFANLNLMSEQYPQWLAGQDVVFYRNVSIYFDSETQRRIFDKLAGLLRDQGWLFVSSTETLSYNQGTLTLVERDGAFCYQKRAVPAVTNRKASASQEPSIHGADSLQHDDEKIVSSDARDEQAEVPAAIERTGNAGDSEEDLFEQALALAKGKQYEHALARVEVLLGRAPRLIKGYMLKAGTLITMQRLDQAEEVCHQCLNIEQWCLEARLLLGMIAKLKQDDELAVARFKDALYIQSSSWLAHFYLGELYRTRGKAGNACREYEIVVRLVKKKTTADDSLTFFPVAFTPEHIMRLCEHHLAHLKGQ